MNSMKQGRLALYIGLSALFFAIIPWVPLFLDVVKFEEWTRNDWFVFVQTLVFLGSAIIAFNTIKTSKNTSKERATLDIIVDDYRDTGLFVAKTEIYEFIENVNEYKNKNKDVTKNSLVEICQAHDSILSEGEKKLKRNLMLVLNRNEFYASGINTNLLDEMLFKRVHCSNILKLWDRLYPTVNQIRQGAKRDTLFKDLEVLAIKWKANPLKSEDIK